MLGLAAALVLGVALAVAMHLVPAVEQALRPLVVGSQAVPIPVLAPLIVLRPRVRAGAEDPDRRADLLLPDRGQRRRRPARRRPRRAPLLRSLHASRWQRLRFLEAPSALPSGFTGLKIAAAVAVIGAVLAEWAGSTSGLGHLVVTANAQLESARAFAATVLLVAEAVALYALFSALERRVVSWSPRTVS